MKVCPKCEKQHEAAGKYCSRTCANSRTWSPEDKKKKSLANIGQKGRTGPRAPLSDDHKQRISQGATKRTKERFEQGLITERSVLRRLVADDKGYTCNECKICEWNGKPITLQVDHKDGNAGNNLPSNLRLLCPNCHSQTPTFSGRNKGSGRKSRGLSLR